MTKVPMTIALLLVSAVAAIEVPAVDWKMIYEPQRAIPVAKDYVVGALSKPLVNLRNTVCAMPSMDEAMMRSSLERAADTVVSAISETTSMAPEQMQQALGYVTNVAKQVLDNPNFKPQLDSLQDQLSKTVGYLGENFGNQVQENLNKVKDAALNM